MELGSKVTLTNGGKNYRNSYSLNMSDVEYNKVIQGKPIRHLTASRLMSGVWTVTFKKNTKKRHKELYG